MTAPVATPVLGRTRRRASRNLAPSPPDSWELRALCRKPDADPDDWFPDRGTDEGADRSHRAKKTCGECPVAHQCLTAAIREERGLSAKNRHGIRAGLTPGERADLAARSRSTAA